jgi:hypothetical protein
MPRRLKFAHRKGLRRGERKPYIRKCKEGDGSRLICVVLSKPPSVTYSRENRQSNLQKKNGECCTEIDLHYYLENPVTSLPFAHL